MSAAAAVPGLPKNYLYWPFSIASNLGKPIAVQHSLARNSSEHLFIPNLYSGAIELVCGGSPLPVSS